MGIPDHLTCLLRNLYAGQEAKLELDMEQNTGSKQEKEYVKAIYCHPAYLTYMQSTLWETLEEEQAGIKFAGRNINNLRNADDTTLMAESEEELKGLLMKVKVESEKVGLKLNIQKTKIMASGPTTSWEIDGETVETVSEFILGGSKITADGDCSHEIKRRLLLGRKIMTNLKSILKSRHYFANQGSSSQDWFFQWSCMDVRVGLWRKLSTEELMLLNCGVGEESWESLGLQGDPTSSF